MAQLCQKANNKISAFSRVSSSLSEKQSLLLYTSFIVSQFNYCPLIWMFCGKVANNELNRTHKRALRILFNDYTSTFNELLHRGNECTIHQKNLQKLMLEVYNSLTQQNPSFLCDTFYEKDNDYNLRSKNLLMLPQTKQLLMAMIVYLFVVAYYGIPCLMTIKLPPPSVPSNHA